jgi:hypothetical protein
MKFLVMMIQDYSGRKCHQELSMPSKREEPKDRSQPRTSSSYCLVVMQEVTLSMLLFFYASLRILGFSKERSIFVA